MKACLHSLFLHTENRRLRQCVHGEKNQKNEQVFLKVLLTPYPRRGAVNAREFPLNEQKKVGTSFRFGRFLQP